MSHSRAPRAFGGGEARLWWERAGVAHPACAHAGSVREARAPFAAVARAAGGRVPLSAGAASSLTRLTLGFGLTVLPRCSQKRGAEPRSCTSEVTAPPLACAQTTWSRSGGQSHGRQGSFGAPSGLLRGSFGAPSVANSIGAPSTPLSPPGGEGSARTRRSWPPRLNHPTRAF